MTLSRLLPTNKRTVRTYAALYCVCLVVVGLLTAMHTRRLASAVAHLQPNTITQTIRRAQTTRRYARVLNTLTLTTIPAIRSLAAASESAHAGLTLIHDAHLLDSGIETRPLPEITTLHSLTNSLETYIAHSERSLLLKTHPAAYELLEHAQLLTHIVTATATGQHEIVIFFQNSDELRPTGGFLGSFARTSIEDGVIQRTTIEDIYDADGQFIGFKPAPAGVQEYLSAGEGLRLPNANWSPHFPESATELGFFLSQSGIQNLTVVGVATDSILEDILRVTGPVELPDYPGFTLSETTATTVLRDARGEFFAGSRQKKHVLQHAVTQLIERMQSLKTEQQLQLFSLIASSVERKHIQLFSPQPTLQTQFAEYGASGALFTAAFAPDQAEFLGLVESNVGINKANSNITRFVTTTINDASWNVRTTFINNHIKTTETALSDSIETVFTGSGAQDDSYVNYYRILVGEDWEVDELTIQGTPASWEEAPYSPTLTQPPISLKQIATLVVVPEDEVVEVSLKLTKKTPTLPSLYVWKQAGIEPFDLTLQTQSEVRRHTIDQDTVLNTL